MTTRYVKNRVSFVSSLASDYSRPNIRDTWEKTFSTTDEVVLQSIECATSGTTIDTDDYGTVSFFGVYNEDSTNYVSVAWTNNGTANIQRVPAGEFIFLTGLTVASHIVITADTAACVCRVVIGAT